MSHLGNKVKESMQSNLTMKRETSKREISSETIEHPTPRVGRQQKTHMRKKNNRRR